MQKLIRGCRLLGVPAIVTEQNPAGLWPTVPEIAALLPDALKAIKFSFSCCAEPAFSEQLKILYPAVDYRLRHRKPYLRLSNGSGPVEAGYKVQVVSRRRFVADAAKQGVSLAASGRRGRPTLTGVEMALFELLRTAKAEQFKAISALIKE